MTSMELDLITLKRHGLPLVGVVSASMTTDLQLLSLLKQDHLLEIRFVTSKRKELLRISDVYSYLWQEDATCSDGYNMLNIGEDRTVYFRNIQVSDNGIDMGICVSWQVESIFENFLATFKGATNLKATEILKYQAKEAVVCYNGKYVATFFLSSSEQPQISSFIDAVDSRLPARKILLVRETLFVLDHAGTTLSSYCMSSNSKRIELDLSSSKINIAEAGTIYDFVISRECDLLIVITEFSRIYCMALGKTVSTTQFPSSTVVTAFTKQFPSVQPVSERQRCTSMSAYSSLLRPVTLSPDMFNMKFVHVVLYNGKLCFLQSCATHMLVGMCQLGNDKLFVKRLEGQNFLLCGNFETFPLLLLQNNKLSLILYDIEHNKLINELMMYQCSKTAESLSELNHWQNICISIEVLKQGLKNRQLDDIQFFLKTHEDRFMQLCNKSPRVSTTEVRSERESWVAIMDTLIERINTMSLDCHARHFVKELSKISTACVIRLLDNISRSTSAEEISDFAEEKQLAISFFAECLQKLRTMMSEDPKHPSFENQNSAIINGLNTKILNQWAEWDASLSWKEIICHSLIKGDVTMAQSYFLNHSDKNQQKHGNLHEFHEVGLELVSDCLKRRSVTEAILILSNMGLSVNEKLVHIFKYTSEKESRQVLLEELVKQNLLTERDKKSSQFLENLEKFYPCSSFSHAKQLQDEKTNSRPEKHCAIYESESEALCVGDLEETSGTNYETGAYSRVILDWLTWWSDDVRERTLLPHLLSGPYESDITISPESVWEHLLEYGDVARLLNWINTWVNSEASQSAIFPFNLPLTPRMIDSVTTVSPGHVSDIVLKELLKHGIIDTNHRENIAALLSICGKAMCDLNNPIIFSSPKSTLSFKELCHKLTHYCLEQNLMKFLFPFMINHHKRFSEWPICSSCDGPLLKMANAVCLWSQHEDTHSALQVMVTTAEQVYNCPIELPLSFTTNIPFTVKIAIQLFSDETLSEAVKREDISSMFVTNDTDRLLMESVFASKGNRQISEVSVYKLLQDNSIFDISKLFGWQGTNPFVNDESMKELSHFSMEQLSTMYGLKESLNHYFYLIEGRPNFAYLKFLAQEIRSATQISFSRVRLCCKEVLSFALSNFLNEKICTSCIVFIEMLGQDSLPLRTCLVNANSLFQNQQNKDNIDVPTEKLAQEISRLFISALDDREAATTVISHLEAEVIQRIHSENSKSLVTDIVMWIPIVTLAHFYDVSVGEAYLCDCAKQDNWLKYLTFAQVFQLPKDLILRVLAKFKSSCIGSHLSKALEKGKLLVSDMPYQVTKVKVQNKRDLRKSLYSRIGVMKEMQKPMENQLLLPEQEEETASLYSLDTSASTSSDPETSPVIIMKDLFLQLLECHNTDIPWLILLRSSLALSNPILSLAAASYPDSDTLMCLSVWLITALPKEKCEVENAQQILTVWTESDLERTIVRSVQDQKILLLWQGICLFLPNSPLLLLMKYLVSFFVYKKFDSSKDTLIEFKNRVAEYVEEESALLHQTRSWIEATSCVILKEAIIACPTSYERILFLNDLASESVFVGKDCAPDFCKLYKMVDCLKDVGDSEHIESLLRHESHPSYLTACWQCVKRLLRSHAYTEAETFARVTGLPDEQVLFMLMKQELEEAQKSDGWSHIKTRIDYWKQFVKGLKKNTMNPACIVEFLKTECENSDKYGEKCFLTQIIIQNQKETLQGQEDDLFFLVRNMWWWLIKELENGECSPEMLDMLLPTSTINMSFMHVARNTVVLTEEKELIVLEAIISHLLSKKQLNQAFEVADFFNHDCKDLKAVRTCLALARSEIDPMNVDVDHLSMSSNFLSPLRKKSVVLWTTAFESSGSKGAEVIKVMKMLWEKTTVAAPICELILVNYTISVVLNQTYDEVKEICPFALLKSILRSNYKEKFDLARSLITVYELKDDNVAAYLCSEIYSSIQLIPESSVMLPENHLATAEEEDILFDPSFSSDSFQLTVRLCQDPALLGRKLMFHAESLFNEYELNNSGSLCTMVELCICAHTCYTAACSVDGISQVLHKSRKLVTFLADARKFSLMVTLLTGIGRYSEMKYVFDKLHEHNQIESQLLKRKLRKVPYLRLALLDYLKRYPSSDNYYSAFVHSFNMEREIAQDREYSARSNLAQLCKSSTDQDLKKKLTDIMKDLVAAAENYCQAECLLQAQLCAELVNLVSLQIHLCDTGKWVLCLDEMSVALYISEASQFSEAVIVADAYKHHQSWGPAIFNNVVCNGNKNYFSELQEYFGPSESLIEDVSRLYLVSPTKSEIQAKNMKWLLTLCRDIELKHSLANLLDFEDIVQQMNMGENSAFLQDLVSIRKVNR